MYETTSLAGGGLQDPVAISDISDSQSARFTGYPSTHGEAYGASRKVNIVALPVKSVLSVIPGWGDIKGIS